MNGDGCLDLIKRYTKTNSESNALVPDGKTSTLFSPALTQNPSDFFISFTDKNINTGKNTNSTTNTNSITIPREVGGNGRGEQHKSVNSGGMNSGGSITAGMPTGAQLRDLNTEKLSKNNNCIGNSG